MAARFDNFLYGLLPARLSRRLAESAIARRLARGSVWALVNSLVVKTASLVQAVFLARLLGPHGFGEWGLILSTIATAGVFASFGLAMSATKHVAELRRADTDRLGSLLGLLTLFGIGTGSVACALLVAFSQPLAGLVLSAPQLADPLIIVGVIIWLSAVSSVFQGALAGLERFADLAAINGFSTLGGVIVTVLLTVPFGLSGAVAGLLLTSAATMFALAVRGLVLLRADGIRLSFARCHLQWRAVWNVSMPATVASLMAIPMYWIAYAVLVRQQDGYTQMGVFQAANQWRTVVMYLPSQLLAAFLPVMSSLAISDAKSFRSIRNRAFVSIGLISFTVALPMAIASPWLMAIYGESFSGYSIVMVLLVCKGAIEAMNLVLQESIVALGRVWYLLISNAAFSVCMLLGIVWAVPAYVALGLAATLLIAQALHLAVQTLMANAAIRKTTSLTGETVYQ